jgi:multiple sugar transport system substrate-binding protein
MKMKDQGFSLITLLFVILQGLFSVNAQERISFWTTEVEKDRLEVQLGIARAFTKKSQIEVQVVPVQENLLAERVTAAYAAKSLPDVIYLPLDFTAGWAESGILDILSATTTVKHLGKETFGRGPLHLVQVAGGYAAVPTDGWGQLLLYRKDLFEKKGLAVPDQWARILDAAKALHNPPSIWGFEPPTDPGQIYTQQVFEHLALSNGVKLTDLSGDLSMNTPEMIEVLEFYKELNGYAPPGNRHWLHTRMDYLSGRAAMTIWSPFILDELSGLRKDQPVIPDMTEGKQGFLAKNTGFVSILTGPNGSAQYGQINYLGITQDANKAAAIQWVEFLLTEGYLQWLGMAAEGKLPLHKGTRDEPDFFIKGWMELELGVTTRARISQFYGTDVVDVLMSGLDGFDRWGFTEGKGGLVLKIYGTKMIPEILKQYLDGEINAKQAARMMDERVKALEE